MKPVASLISAFAIVGTALTGCATDPTQLSDDATAFTRPELYAYLSDKTQVWDQGGAYYSAEGKLETLWDGERDEGTWSTTKNGELCWHVKSWGEIPCETYYHNGDVVSIVYKGETSAAPQQHEGNQLDALAAGTAPVPVEDDSDFVKVLFTKEETTALVSGKTVIWDPNGGAYYAPDGTLKTVWDGERATGTWSVNDEGGVCWQVPGWGTTPCEFYFYKEDVLWAQYKDEDSEASEHVDGDQTGSL